MSLRVAINALMVGAICAQYIRASPLQIFGSEAAFLSASPIVSIETFDQIPQVHVTESQVEIDGVFYRNSPAESTQGWSITNSVVNAQSKPNVLVSNTVTENHISFGTGQTVQAFGFFMIGGGTSNGVGARYRFIVKEANDVLSSFLIDFAPPGVKYLGFLSQQGIVEIAIGPDPSQDFGVFFAYDNVSRSEISVEGIPEPSTVLLIGAGLTALYLRRRTQQ